MPSLGLACRAVVGRRRGNRVARVATKISLLTELRSGALRTKTQSGILSRMSNEQFDRDTYTIELLRYLADGGKFEGDQIGPDHTLEQISVAEDLIKKGFMRGKVFRDGGTATNIGSPEITTQGRNLLKYKTSERPTPYEQFCWSVFDDSVGAQRDGVDFEALALLTPEQKSEVSQRVLAALTETNESRPFIAAGAMKLRASSSILKQRLASGFKKNFDYMRVHCAHALYLIEQWPDAITIILEVLQNTPKTPDHQWTRMMAIEALADFINEKLAFTALFAAVEDEDDFIGFLAIKSLEKLFGHDRRVIPLLEALEETQKKPQRWQPDSLDQRQRLFVQLENMLGVRMPTVAMEKKEIPVPTERRPDVEQMPLFGGGDTKE